MQKKQYLCRMKSVIAIILLVAQVSLDEVIMDIYRAATEVGEVDYEQLQTDLYALHDNPIDLNNTSDEELAQLLFLSPRQIDDILLYADKHPFESLYELRMIASLTDYEIRDLLPFVTISSNPLTSNPLTPYPKEVFRGATHEVLARVDARNIENYEGTDPIYTQTRYRFDYHRRVVFGAQLRRPAGGGARDLQYGAYLQLKDIGCLHTLVAGNYQASFGQGLVFAPVFRTGKSSYVSSVGQTQEGLRYYSSVDGESLHGAGATFRKLWSKSTRLDISALYSMKRANDSTWHHLVGANLTMRHNRLQVELTAAENIWTDSIHPYRNTGYNEHYFRGYRQAVLGASVRYNHGWFDAFAEVAASQNRRWGAGVLAGSRFYPTEGVSLVALYRYYSPWFDNALGYAFSESSRIGDENGGYLGFDITRLSRWRFSGYADVFYFSGIKYGIPYAPSMGYDVLGEVQYHAPKEWWLAFRLRAREKGGDGTYSARFQFDWMRGGWSLRTTADANITSERGNALPRERIPYGVSIAQDIGYTFSSVPLALKGRLQFFDAREWANRIYLYENDVLYAFSVPASYGLGGRMYLCLRWQIIPQMALYFRASETIYAPSWTSGHDRKTMRTDLHLLLRAKL